MSCIQLRKLSTTAWFEKQFQNKIEKGIQKDMNQLKF